MPASIHRLATSLVLFFAIGSAREATAVLLAYEGFNYAVGQRLPTMAGGTGWGAAWTGDDAFVDQPPTLSYPTALPSTGDALLSTGGDAGRLFSAPLSNAGSDLWISFQELSTVAGSGATVYLPPGGLYVQKTPLGEIDMNGWTAGYSAVGKVDFFLLQITQFNPPASTISFNLWLDPGPVLGPPNAFYTQASASPDLLQQFFYRSDSGQALDEIRVGTTLSDVFVPESGTLLLLGSGLAGLAALGRRQRV